jgi:hypothetical protein
MLTWLILAPVLLIAAAWLWILIFRNRTRMNISDEIKKANSFGDQIENLVVARGACPTGDRNTLLGYWSLMFDHHRGILSTLSNSFCGSAFALVRPMVEAAVRSHVTMLGFDDDLAKLHEDTYRTNFGTIGKWIDTTFHMEAYFETFLKGAKDALHSYTHAGMRQIERRFTGTDLVANYNDGEIVEVIRVSCSAIFMVNNLSRSVSTLKKNGMKITALSGMGKRS